MLKNVNKKISKLGRVSKVLTLNILYPATNRTPGQFHHPYIPDLSPYNRFVYFSLYINIEGGWVSKVAVWVYNLLWHSVTYCSVIWERTRPQYSHFRMYCELITLNEMRPCVCLCQPIDSCMWSDQLVTCTTFVHAGTNICILTLVHTVQIKSKGSKAVTHKVPTSIELCPPRASAAKSS